MAICTLKEARVAAGLSQRALAELAGSMSQADVSTIERGLRRPQPATVERLAKALASKARPERRAAVEAWVRRRLTR
jgi:transcriptional regulator with XRE-family HTH domain